MDRSTRRPRNAAGPAATLVGCYLAAALIAGAVVFLPLPGDGPVIVVCVAVVGALVLGHLATRYPGWLQLGAFFPGAAFVVVAGYAAHSTVLDVHGSRVTAFVMNVAVQHGPRDTTTYHYTLVTELGRPIPGTLDEASDEFAVGEQVQVVVDRGNRVAPKTTGEVDAAGPLWTAALICLALTVLFAALAGLREAGLRKPG